MEKNQNSRSHSDNSSAKKPANQGSAKKIRELSPNSGKKYQFSGKSPSPRRKSNIASIPDYNEQTEHEPMPSFRHHHSSRCCPFAQPCQSEGSDQFLRLQKSPQSLFQGAQYFHKNRPHYTFGCNDEQIGIRDVLEAS